ncbi:MAG: PorT family protein [Bacteroidales bacterium]|nr:PorT family protein [Bacteroidales bacterium]
MKKLLVAFAAMLVAGSAFAQIGIVAGVTSSKTSLDNAVAEAEDINQFHFGIAAKFNLLGGVSVQPAVLYNVKGTKLGSVVKGTSLGDYSADLKTGFVEVPVQIQWGVELSSVRPYVFAEPFVGYAVTNETKEELVSAVTLQESNKGFDTLKNRLEYGFGLGVGVDLFDSLQLSVRYFWNMGELYEDNVSAITSVQSAINAASGTAKSKKCSGIMATLAIFF